MGERRCTGDRAVDAGGRASPRRAARRGRRRSGIAVSVSIVDVGVATIQGALPAPVVFGDWIMRHREYAVVRVPRRPGTRAGRSRSRVTARSPSRSARRSRRSTSARIRPIASACSVSPRGGSLASHAAGIGLRALSIVDLAVWDVAARIADTLDRRPARRTQPADARRWRSSATRPGRWVPRRRASRRLSCTRPAGGASRRRSRRPPSSPPLACAPHAPAPRRVDRVRRGVDLRRRRHGGEFVESIDDVGLGWFEDVFPPGDAGLRARAARTRHRADRHGRRAGRQLLPRGADRRRRRRRRAHRPHVHGRHHRRPACHRSLPRRRRRVRPAHVRPRPQPGLLRARLRRRPVEWGVPWTGVDPYADSLAQPVDRRREDGATSRAGRASAACSIVEWVTSQPHDDPQHILN